MAHKPAHEAADRTSEYNYLRFGVRHYNAETLGGNMDALGGVQVGEPAPDFTATRLDGTAVKLSDYRGKPVVLEAGSASCPMYVHNVESMNALAHRFPDVEFLVLYVREAHPGQRIGPHRSAEQKCAAASLLVEQERERRTILIDDPDGTAHRMYGAMPNTAHVIDANGTVVYRTIWNDSQAVETVLERLTAGQGVGVVPARHRPAGPGVMVRVLHRAGWVALWDFAKALPRLAWVHARPGRRH